MGGARRSTTSKVEEEDDAGAVEWVGGRTRVAGGGVEGKGH